MPQLATIVTGNVSGIVIIVAPTEVLLLIALISTITLGFWFGRLVLKGGHLRNLFSQVSNRFLELFGLSLLSHSN